MRRLGPLFVLLFSLPLGADIVAGPNWILFHDRWARIAGGPVTPLERPVWTAAFDGERFLTGWRDGDMVWLALYDEGATIPVTITSLGISGRGEPIVRWNGSTFVVVIEGGPAQIALVSRQGIVETLRPLPEVKSIVDLAAGAGGIAVLSRYETATHQAVLEVALLDSSLRVARKAIAGTIVRSTGMGGTYFDVPRIAPFGNIFYVAWREGRAGRWDQVVGTRVLLEGSAPDTRPSTRERDSVSATLLSVEAPNPYLIALHQYGPRMAVQPIRQWGAGIITTFIEPDGFATQTEHRMTIQVPPPPVSTVQRQDGSLWMVYVRDGQAVVRKMLGPPPPVRRRSLRH
jgi:hypothetical protein